MRSILFIILAIGITGIAVTFTLFSQGQSPTHFQEPEFKDVGSDLTYERIERRFPNIANWKRPDVPPTVGLQVGHWKTKELPDELERLR